jgi:hypothetical protein
MADQDTSLKPFDPVELQKRVADTVRGQFAALIPDDQWLAMVKKYTTDFIGGNVTDGKPSLKGMVIAELQAETKKKLGEFFASPEWSSHWDAKSNNGNVAGEKARQFVLENLSMIVTDLLSGAVQRGIDTFRSSLANSGRQW